jgi:hypothetical protein
MDYAAKPLPGHTQPEILICVPLRYPVSQSDNKNCGEIVGVITLNTNYRASKLLTVYEDETLQKALALEFQAFLLKDILPALGFDEEWA